MYANTPASMPINHLLSRGCPNVYHLPGAEMINQFIWLVITDDNSMHSVRYVIQVAILRYHTCLLSHLPMQTHISFIASLWRRRRVRKMCEANERQRYRIEKLPPEGGWGYLIGIGMALPFVSAAPKSYRVSSEAIQRGLNFSHLFCSFYSFLVYSKDLCIKQHALIRSNV